MKIAIASDVHLEFGDLFLNNEENADVLILSGDICVAADFRKSDPYGILENGKTNRYTDFFVRCANEFKNVKYDSMKELHYGGTCGCVIDANIFRFNAVFHCPNEYRNIEDLWLSYVVKQVVGGKINLIREPIKMHQFDNEGETALWKTIGERKSVFLRLLIECGYIKTKGFNKDKLGGLIEEKDDSQKLIDNFTF